jgi:hypothetical protein
LYISALHTIGGGSLVYYRGIAVIFGILILGVSCVFFAKCSFENAFPAVLLAATLVYSFHITIPVILDRSISIQVIGSLSTDKPLHIEEINQKFLQGYVDGYSTSCRRLDEQLATGNIKIADNKVTLTKKGLAMKKTFNLIAEILKVEDHYIKGNLDQNYLHHFEVVDGKCTKHQIAKTNE